MSAKVLEKTNVSNGTNLSDKQHEAIVLGIIMRRPISSVATSDFPRLIAMCERILAKEKSNPRFVTLLARLKKEEYKRHNNGRKPFAANATDRYTEKDLPEKAVKALIVLGKIVDRFAETGGEDFYLLAMTTKEAVAAFETGNAYGMRTRSAFLPPVFRHLLVQIAKNLKDPIPVVQDFTNDKKKIALLDKAWGGGESKDVDAKPEEKKPIKIVNDPRFSNKVHAEERIVGKRAAYHVCFESDEGKTFEPSYANSVEEAIEAIQDSYRVLKKSCRIFAVVICNPEKKL